jgi:hypothetical protein
MLRQGLIKSCSMVKNIGVIRRLGYYISTTGDRQRLHVAMWEAEYGVSVPRGCVIHHLNWDKDDNRVDNLICVTVREHEMIHNIIGNDIGKKYGYELLETRVDGLPPNVVK